MTLTPHVYWAQRHEEIYLRVELTDAQVSLNCFMSIHHYFDLCCSVGCK